MTGLRRFQCRLISHSIPRGGVSFNESHKIIHFPKCHTSTKSHLSTWFGFQWYSLHFRELYKTLLSKPNIPQPWEWSSPSCLSFFDVRIISHDFCLVCSFDLTIPSADKTHSPCPLLYFASLTKFIDCIFDRGEICPSQNKLAGEDHQHGRATVWLGEFDQRFPDESLMPDLMDSYNLVAFFKIISGVGRSPSGDLKARFCVPWTYHCKRHICGLSGNRRCPLNT